MKRFFPLVVMTFLALLLTNTADAQDFDFPQVDKSPMDMSYYPDRAAFRNFAKTEAEKQANEPVIRAIYSRPSKKGRAIFGELEKFGTTWRVGANETTELKFFKDVTIGGTKVPAGTYTLFAVLGEKEWKVVLNTDLYGWGAYVYDESKDVASITVPTETVKEPIEVFSIIFEKVDDGVHMIMGWDDTVVRVPIQL
ncbi:MAG: DUF2911 domain-containing protein [Bacteroidota bacterium]